MTTYEALQQHGALCVECQRNAAIIADWLSTPDQPVTTDVVIGMAWMLAANNEDSLHHALQLGIMTIERNPRITRL